MKGQESNQTVSVRSQRARWIALGTITSIVLCVVSVSVFLIAVTVTPVSGALGELLDSNSKITVSQVDPAVGVAPTVSRIWDMQSYLRAWGVDYLNPPVLYDGIAFVRNESETTCWLWAISIETRSPIWKTEIGCYPNNRISVTQTSVIVIDGVFIEAFDRQTGEHLWTRTDLHYSKGEAIDDVFVITRGLCCPYRDGARVLRLDPSTGHTLWSTTPESLEATFLGTDNLYVLADSQLIAIDLGDGQIQWKCEITGLRPDRSLAVGNGVAVVWDTHPDRHMVAIDLATRAVLWRFDPSAAAGRQGATSSGHGNFPPVVLATTVYVTVVEQDNWTGYSLDLNTGRTLWTIAASPVLYTDLADCGQAICAFADGREALVSLDP